MIVLVLGIVITITLSLLASTANERNEGRLLSLQVSQAGLALGAALSTIETPLASVIATANATNGSATQFATAMAPYIGPGGTFAYAALCQLSSRPPDVVAAVGSQPGQPSPESECSSGSARTVSGLTLVGFVDGGRRIGYVYRPASGPSELAIFVQSDLSPHRRVTFPASFAFGDLEYALYLGRSERSSDLLEATSSQVPIVGRRAVSVLPFANTSLTLVGTPVQPLGGTLSRRLALIVAVLGALLTIGAVLMTERLVRRRHSAEELAAENRQLYAEQASIAGTLQRALLPKELPQIDGLALDARYVAGLDTIDVGGDWYDVISCTRDRSLFVVGDVSGKGLRAAILMASLHYAIRAYAVEDNQPHVILKKLCSLLDIGRDGHFATVLCGSIDLNSRTVTLASAGHFPPLLMSPRGAEFVRMTVGPPVGVVTGTDYIPTTVALPDQGTLLAFTDGLIERRGESLEVSLARLREVAGDFDHPLDALLADVVNRLIPNGSDDDLAILGLRWQGGERQLAPASTLLGHQGD
jgi:serine phosphatase RsbU (regulator of sigma subunit)/type II secretory pathway pseudopilin PulG